MPRSRLARLTASAVAVLTLASLLSVTDLAPGATTAAHAATSTTFEETNPAIKWSGVWRPMSATADSAQQANYLNESGSAKLAFVGTAVSWMSRTSPTSGTSDVLIDGVKVTSVDRYSADKSFNVPVFTKTGLTNAAHTIEVVWTGARNVASGGSNLLIDAFRVTTDATTTSLAPTTTTSTITASTITATASAPGAPGLAISDVSERGISLAWTPPTTTPSRYVIKRSADGINFGAIATLSASTTKYLDVNVTPGVKFSYSVSAINSAGAVASVSGIASAPAKAISLGTGYRAANCPSATVTVGTATALKSALSKAAPGSVIKLLAGTYTGEFSVPASGTSTAPIWVCGPRTAIITTGSASSGHAVTIDSKHDIVLAGVTVRNSFKGITVVNSQRIVATDLLVENIGYEAIHLRNQTSDSEVKFNTIRKIGLVKREFGEGIYLGTSDSNWCKFNNCLPDRTVRIRVLGNTISETGAQAIEVKAGSSDGVIAGNVITGALPGAAGEGWVLVKGNNWLVAGNTGANSPDHGFATNASVTGWGKYNIFARNNAKNTAGYGVWIHEPSGVADLKNMVSCLGAFSSTADGITNVTCMK